MRKTKLQEFLTPKRTLVLQDKKGKNSRQYQLGYYNLFFQNLIYLEFATEENPNGIENFINRLSNNDPMACLKGIYFLIEDKSDFPKFEDFTKTLDKFQFSLDQVQLLLMRIMQDSMPDVGKKKVIKLLLITVAIMTISVGLLYLI